MGMYDDHSSMMMLGLVNTLANKGELTEKERKSILNLGHFMEDLNKLREAKNLVREINDILAGGKNG